MYLPPKIENLKEALEICINLPRTSTSVLSRTATILSIYMYSVVDRIAVVNKIAAALRFRSVCREDFEF